jgi:hypothetical protein
VGGEEDHVFGGFFSFVEGVAGGYSTGSSPSDGAYSQYHSKYKEASKDAIKTMTSQHMVRLGQKGLYLRYRRHREWP